MGIIIYSHTLSNTKSKSFRKQWFNVLVHLVEVQDMVLILGTQVYIHYALLVLAFLSNWFALIRLLGFLEICVAGTSPKKYFV